MGKKLAGMLVVGAVLAAGTGVANAAVIFSQNFNSSSTVSDYVGAPPSSGQFDQITTSGAGTVASISGGALQYARTANSGSFTRTTDFSPTPTLMSYTFDFSISGNSAAASSAAIFYVGTGLPLGGTTPTNATQVYARLAINFTATAGEFQIRDLSSSTNSANLAGTQSITWILNNSGSTQNYTAPGGASVSVANDTADIYAGSTLLFNDAAVTSAGLSMTDLKFLITGGVGTVKIDNIVIQDVLPSGGTPSFIFTDTSAVTINTLKGSSSSTASKTIQNNGTASGDATLSSVTNLSVSGTTTGIGAGASSALTLSAASTATYQTTSGTLTVTLDGGANEVSVTVNVGNAVADTDGDFTAANALTAAFPSTVAGLSSKVVTGSSVAIQSEATLLEADDPTSNSAISMNWRDRTAAEQTKGNAIFGGKPVLLASDVVDLTGVIGGGLNLYTIQMSYDQMGMSDPAEAAAAAGGFIYLGWLNGGTWVNAGTDLTPDLDGYQVSTDFFLGNWGVNTSNNTVWAVVNHSSEFAALIPEPASLGLLAFGGLALLGRRRK